MGFAGSRPPINFGQYSFDHGDDGVTLLEQKYSKDSDLNQEQAKISVDSQLLKPLGLVESSVGSARQADCIFEKH